jgi:hypothetical protein
MTTPRASSAGPGQEESNACTNRREDAEPNPAEEARRRGRGTLHEKVLVGLFLLSLPFVTPYIRGDGVKYYAWLRSPAIDADLHFLNEYRHGDPVFRELYFRGDATLEPEFWSPTGLVENQASVGEAVLWSPFFLLGHGIVVAGRALGASWDTDGYSLPYVWLTAFGTALYVFAGLLVTFRLARRLTEPGPAFLATVAVWGATSLPVYQYFLPIKGVPMTVFPATLLLCLWVRAGWGTWRWTFLGLLSGLLVTVHPVAVAWVMLPALSLGGLDPGPLRPRARAAAVFAGGGLIGALPQLIGKAIVYGNPFETGYPDVHFKFLNPDFPCVLVGACRGFLVWTPITIFALAGLALLLRKDRRLAIGLWAVFLSIVYILASKLTPEISSYGNRFSVIFTPGFVVGAAALAQAIWHRRRVMAVAFVTVAIAWNGLLAFQWAWGMLPKRGAVDWSEVAKAQFTTAPRQFARALVLFTTDRGKLIRIMQQRDLERLRAEEGFP